MVGGRIAAHLRRLNLSLYPPPFSSLRTLYERSSLTHAPGLPHSLPVSGRRELERLEAHLPRGAFEWTARGISWKSYCGLVRVGEETWEILPKTWRGDGFAPEAARPREVLLRLLQAAGLLPWSRESNLSLDSQRLHLLEIFILIFCRQLNQALSGGLARAYRQETSDLTLIRGRFDVQAHSRALPHRKHQFLCHFDEFDADIPLNRCFRFLIRRLLAACTSSSHPRVLRSLEALEAQFLGHTESLDFHSTDAALPPRHTWPPEKLPRTLARFQSAWSTARWLLAGLFPDLKAGRQGSEALLFDMQALFESAVSRSLRRRLEPEGWTCTLQGPRRRLLLEGGDFPSTRVMKPDIVLQRGSECLVLDCKWKVLDPNAEALGLSQADLYQLHTYAVEYSATSVGLLFPWVPGLPENPVEYRFPALPVPVCLWFIDLENADFAENWAADLS